MNRRDLVRLGWATVIATGAGKLRPTFAQSPALRQGPVPPPHQMVAPLDPKARGRAADFTLRIAPMMLELAPQVVISTIGYSNTVPGPLLRVREGQPIAVEVVNETDVPEYVHWHGLFVPSDVDGVEEEGTPPVPPHGRRRYRFVAKPAGSRWYHSHTEAMMDLHRGAYTGQFGFFMIDSANDPELYDQEVFLALREWEPYLTTMDPDEEAPGPNDPMPEKPTTPDPRPNGLEVNAPPYSINDKMLGAGEPLRVRSGQRILIHLLNAGASQIHRVALSGHQFQVIALDRNPVPSPQAVDVIEIAPGERVDAIIEMNRPGVWILGALREVARRSGMGIVVEYADQHQHAQWIPPRQARWDYTIFGNAAPHPAPDQVIDMVFEKVPGGPHGINHWLVNGKEYPHEREFVFRQGGRYRLVFHNRSDDSHPLHIHRHLFELVELNGRPTAGTQAQNQNSQGQSSNGNPWPYGNPTPDNTWPYATIGRSPVLAVVGDVACQPGEEPSGEKAGENCDGDTAQNLYASQAATAKQIENMKPDLVALLGDEQYQVGQYSDFESSYELTYGAFKSITRPSPGNHEFYTEHGAVGVAGYGYFSYFNGVQHNADGTMMMATIANNPDTGGTFTQPVPYSDGQAGHFEQSGGLGNSTLPAGAPVGVGDGWYSYNLGAWHLISLNIECETQPGGCTGSWFAAELAWLKKDLAANHSPCTLAYWHQPSYSAADSLAVPEGPTALAFWQLLYQYGADLVLNGHDHLYARYRPLDPSGHYDPHKGIREFIVGTGGETLDTVVESTSSTADAGAQFNAVNLEAASGQFWGVMALTLDPNGYKWDFESALKDPAQTTGGSTYSDKGVGSCHGPANRDDY